MNFAIKTFNELTIDELYEIVKSRFEVFVCEQKIIEDQEFDDKDKVSYHIMLKENDKVVVSIFVNPTQFGKNEDLGSYPRDLERDIEVCTRGRATAIFNPEVEEMYCDNASTFVNITGLTEGLCGASRPIHFRGVCTVVSNYLT